MRKIVLTSASANFALFLIAALFCTPSLMAEILQRAQSDAAPPRTITVTEAESLINLLSTTRELRAKGMELKWDVQDDVSNMNGRDYYFFWVYSVTAQKQHDISSISVGNYVVNKHTADVRAWQVSDDVFYGNDGVLITSNEIEKLQEQLRQKYGIDPSLIQEYRERHLAARIIPRALAQSALASPVTERLRDTSQVSCWTHSDHLVSRLGTSATISSGAGNRAYAEVRAIAFSPKYPETYTGTRLRKQY